MASNVFALNSIITDEAPTTPAQDAYLHAYCFVHAPT